MRCSRLPCSAPRQVERFASPVTYARARSAPSTRELQLWRKYGLKYGYEPVKDPSHHGFTSVSTALVSTPLGSWSPLGHAWAPGHPWATLGVRSPRAGEDMCTKELSPCALSCSVACGTCLVGHMRLSFKPPRTMCTTMYGARPPVAGFLLWGDCGLSHGSTGA
jgi:hypothetical protein